MSGGSHHTCNAKIAADANAMSVTTTPNDLPIDSVRARGQYEVGGLGFAAADRNLLAFRPEPFVPRRHRVLAGRQAGQCEGAARVRDREVWRPQHGEIAVHPGVHIAFDRNELRLVPRGPDWRRSLRLRLVPLGIDAGEWMDVV